MRKNLAVLASVLLGVSAGSAAHNAETHRDATAYAFELMAVAGKDEIRQRFAGNAEMLQFIDAMTSAARFYEGLPADLPAPHRDRCFDIKVIERFATFSPLGTGAGSQPAGIFPVPVDLQFFSNDKSCGVDPYWHVGTLYHHFFPNEATHAGNVLGFWSAHTDELLGDIEMEARITNVAGAAEIKQIFETAGGAAAGTVWVSAKCLGKCFKGLFSLDLSDCKKCVSDAYDAAKDEVHDGIATVDALVPGIPLGDLDFLREITSGVCHHIDAKGDVLAPGWSTVSKSHYDDISGLYGATPGPYGVPGQTEELALLVTRSLGVSVDYDHSDGPKNYEVTDGNDFHPNSVARRRQDWEYLTWPDVPMPPLDNLAWYGWDKFKGSVAQHRADNSQPIQMRYIGWVLHGLGDSTVPMHVTGTFAWGHRPYEDAEAELGRQLLGDYQAEVQPAAGDAETVLQAALAYRKQILAWRAAHPDHARDVPVRDLVTDLAQKTLAAAAAHSAIYDDDLSTAWNIPGPPRGASIMLYKPEAQFMQARLRETVAATIAFLTSAAELP